MEIRQYQSGGIVYTPYFSQPSTATTRSSSSGDNDEEDSILKEMMSVLNEHGLPTDVDTFLSQINRTLSSNSVFPDSGNYSISDLIRVHSLANKVRYSNDLYNSARERLTAENAWSEVAITDNGRLYVVDNQEKVKTISPEAYYNHSEQYNIMTNEELLRWRANSSELAFNDSILNDLNGSVGMNTVINHVLEVINDFGTRNFSLTQSQYVPQSVINGMENIGSTSYEEGLIQITSKQQESHQGYSDENDLADAVSYLYNTLTPNMKNTLRAHVAAEGRNPNSTEDVLSLLYTAIYRNTTHSVISDTDYGNSRGKSGSGSGSSGGGTSVQESYLQMVAHGGVTLHKPISLFPNNSRVSINADGQPYPILDGDGDQIPMTVLSDFLNTAQIGQIVDTQNITFGNRMLNPAEFNKIVYNGTDHMYRADLPINWRLWTQTNRIAPDFSALDKFEDFKRWNINKSNEEILEYLRDHELDIRLNSNGEWEFTHTRTFLMVPGASTNRAIDMSGRNSSQYTVSLPDDEANLYYDFLDNSSYWDEAIWNIWGDANSTYKSTIFMPIQDSGMATVGTGHQYVPRSQYMDILNNREYNQERDRVISGANW